MVFLLLIFFISPIYGAYAPIIDSSSSYSYAPPSVNTTESYANVESESEEYSYAPSPSAPEDSSYAPAISSDEAITFAAPISGMVLPSYAPEVNEVVPSFATSLITQEFVDAFNTAKLAWQSVDVAMSYYQKAFDIIASNYITAGLDIDMSNTTTYPVIVFEALESMVLSAITEESQNILALMQSQSDYSSSLASFETTVPAYNSYIISCTNQIAIGGSQALKDYNDERDKQLFQLYFKLLINFSIQNTAPTTSQIVVAKSYFDECSTLWNFSAPPAWTKTLILPGYGSGDQLRQSFYTAMASLYSSYANSQLTALQELSDLTQFNTVMSANAAVIKNSQKGFAQAAALYTTLASDYQTTEFITNQNTYTTLSTSFSSGLSAYASGDYLSAATYLSSALLNGKPIVSNMLAMKGQQLIADAALASGQSSLATIVSQEVPLLTAEKALMDSSEVTAQLSFISDFVTSLNSIVVQYETAAAAYLAASDSSDAPEIKAYFSGLTSTLLAVNECITDLTNSFGFVKDADLLLPYVAQASDVDSVDANYQQAIALAQTADSKQKTVSKNPDYLLLYSGLASDWSFAQFLSQRAALLFKQRADDVLAASQQAIQDLAVTQQALLIDLYLKAYGYKDYLTSDDQLAIREILKSVDLLAQADALKLTAQQVSDWAGQQGLTYYVSSASSAWQNAVTAYFIAYEINASDTTLFSGADQAYHEVLDEYGQAYYDNVPDNDLKSAGSALIYFRAYLNRLAEADAEGVATYDTKISELITPFFDMFMQVSNNLRNSNFAIASYFYDRALLLRDNVNYFVDRQNSMITSQNQALSLPQDVKLLFIVPEDSVSFSLSSDFNTTAVQLGNLETEFAAWSVQQGDMYLTQANSLIASAAQSYDLTFDVNTVLDAQDSYNLASTAYQKAVDIYNQLQDSQSASSATTSQTAVYSLLYATSQLATVNPQEAATYFDENVFNLYFLNPYFATVPTELLNADVLNFLSQYSLTENDQETLYSLAASYAFSESDWKLFVEYLNDFQFPLQYPLKTDTWQNMISLFANYALTQSQTQELTDMEATYSIPVSVQSVISAYLFYLPTMIYLYNDLNASGLKLSSYNLSYNQVLTYIAGLKGADVPDESTLSAALGSGAATLRENIVNANSYFLKSAAILASSLQGVTGSLLLYQYANATYLIENQKVTPALPPSYLSWYPTPTAYYTKANQYFTANQQSMKNVIDQLINRLWLSSASQTQLKMDYILGKFTDTQMIQALTFIDEYPVTQSAQESVLALTTLQKNKTTNPQAVLSASLSEADNAALSVIKYNYLLIATGISGANLDQTSESDALGAIEQEYGLALSNFLIGDPSSSANSSLLSDISSQYLAAQGYFTQQAPKDAAASELADIFSSSALLASSRALPMDTTQTIPALFVGQSFALYDWSTAASLYANAATAAGSVAAKKDVANINALRSYYEIIVQDMTAYLLLRISQGGSFESIAQTYSQWLAQQSSIQKEVVQITQNDIDMYQSINNLILDSLIYSLTLSSVADSLSTTSISDDTATLVSDYMDQKNISTLLTNTDTLSATSWQTLQSLLRNAFDDLITQNTINSDINQALNIAAQLGSQLYGYISSLYILDWESDDVSNEGAQTAINNLISAMQARESAVMTINYLG